MFQPLISAAPCDIAVEIDDSDYSTIVPIAICDSSGRYVSVDCHLSYTQNSAERPGSVWFHEFSFEITCADPNGTYETISTQDRNVAKEYIPTSMRHIIMPIVLASCGALIRRVHPILVYRVTKMRNPNPQALRKHGLITDTFSGAGYKLIETGTDIAGRRYWLSSSK